MRKRVWKCIALVIAALILGAGVTFFLLNRAPKKSWTDYSVVAHAGGGIDGKSGTNSREAMEQAVKKGYGIIEVDLSLTSDNELILFHGWDSDTQDELELDDVDLGENGVPDLETSKNMKICKKYTTMTGEDLVSFMKKNPSIYILTDEKFSNKDQINVEMEKLAELCGYDEKLLSRFIVQIYDIDTYDRVMSVYHFPNLMYATYMYGTDDESYWVQVVEDCQERGIQTISMWNNMIATKRHGVYGRMRILNESGLRICAHTINKLSVVERVKDAGADMIVSDFLYEDDMSLLEDN